MPPWRDDLSESSNPETLSPTENQEDEYVHDILGQEDRDSPCDHDFEQEGECSIDEVGLGGVVLRQGDAGAVHQESNVMVRKCLFLVFWVRLRFYLRSL